jgi:hypothetical protein
MNSQTRDRHRQLDRQAMEAEARDGEQRSQPGTVADIARPRTWKSDNSITGQSAKVLLMQLSERKSARGNLYYRGWLGRASVVGFLGEKDKAGNQTIDLYVSTPQPKAGK